MENGLLLHAKTIANSCAKLYDAQLVNADMTTLSVLINQGKITLKAGLGFLEKISGKTEFSEMLPLESVDLDTPRYKNVDIIYDTLIKAASEENCMWLLCRFLQAQESISDRNLEKLIDADSDAFRILTTNKTFTETEDLLTKAVYRNWKIINNIPMNLWNPDIIKRAILKVDISVFDKSNTSYCDDVIDKFVSFISSSYNIIMDKNDYIKDRLNNDYELTKLLEDLTFIVLNTSDRLKIPYFWIKSDRDSFKNAIMNKK